MKIEKSIEPDLILWENFGYPKLIKRKGLLIKISIILIIFVITLGLILPFIYFQV